MARPNYGSWKLPELRRELRERQIRTTGRKSELVDRLEHWDATQDFLHSTPGPSIPNPSLTPDWPQTSSFSSVTEELLESLPKIYSSTIKKYIIYRQALDKEQNRDLSAFNNGKRLLEHCIEALSYFHDGNR